MIDDRAIDSMKPGAVLVNTARGGLVDYDSLTARSQRAVRGAGLDVYEAEPVTASTRYFNCRTSL